MKSSKKQFIGEAFGSLISNDKAISCSKKSPVWLTILLFFLAIIFAVIPMTVNSANSYGSAFISRTAYGFDKTMTKIALEMSKDGVNYLTVNDNHELNITNSSESPAYKHTNVNTGRVEMEVYFSAAKDSSSKRAFINTVTDHHYVLSDAGETTTYYHSSYVVFFNNELYCCLYELGTENVLTTSAHGDYKTMKPGTDIVTLLTTVDGVKLTPTSDQAVLDILAVSKNQDALLNNWKKVFDKTYETVRTQNTLIGTGIYLGIFAGMSLIMGLLIWIMTRGKNNPFNYLTLWACFKIECWASVAPGLIGLILGFFLTQYAVMIFIMCLGMRVMWISSKQLRPEVR